MKSIYRNRKGYGIYTEEYKKESKPYYIKVCKIFKELISKGYRPSEICFDLIEMVSTAYCTHSITQGLKDRQKERGE